MNKKLHINLTTPEGQTYVAEVDSIVAPGTEGYVGILPGHTYFFTTLAEGKLTIRIDDEESIFQIGQGHMEVHPGGAIIITEKVEGL